jgi:hypothetical protein
MCLIALNIWRTKLNTQMVRENFRNVVSLSKKQVYIYTGTNAVLAVTEATIHKEYALSCYKVCWSLRRSCAAV